MLFIKYCVTETNCEFATSVLCGHRISKKIKKLKIKKLNIELKIYGYVIENADVDIPEISQ